MKQLFYVVLVGVFVTGCSDNKKSSAPVCTPNVRSVDFSEEGMVTEKHGQILIVEPKARSLYSRHTNHTYTLDGKLLSTFNSDDIESEDDEESAMTFNLSTNTVVHDDAAISFSKDSSASQKQGTAIYQLNPVQLKKYINTTLLQEKSVFDVAAKFCGIESAEMSFYFNQDFTEVHRRTTITSTFQYAVELLENMKDHQDEGEAPAAEL